MHNDSFARLRGTLSIEIEGQHPERLLNLALREGLRLSAAQYLSSGRISCEIPLADIYHLRRLTRLANCRLKIVDRKGLPFILAFMAQRPLLPLMAVFGTLLLAFACSIAWQVEVTSPYTLAEADKARVEELSQQAGVVPLRSRWHIDAEAAEQYILDNFPELFYVEIFSRGAKLEISVVRRVDIPEEDQVKAPGHIVATTDGVVRDVLVRRGTAAVQEGDLVQTGQVLIYGDTYAGAPAADGIVTATVYAESYGECAEAEEHILPTGNSSQAILIRAIGGRSIRLAGNTQSPFAQYTTERSVQQISLGRKISLPVELILVKHVEQESHTILHSAEQALEKARSQSQEKAIELIYALECKDPIGEVLLFSEQIDTADQVARFRTVAQAVAEIGRYQQASALQPLPPELDAPQ